jgi:hypothetical protein
MIQGKPGTIAVEARAAAAFEAFLGAGHAGDAGCAAGDQAGGRELNAARRWESCFSPEMHDGQRFDFGTPQGVVKSVGEFAAG